jgi:hypothetical protein
MANSPFIGTGSNPHGADLPLGFGMRLAQDPQAMDTFGAMDQEGKERVISYIQCACTGDDAMERLENAVNALKNNNESIFC